MLPIRTSSTTAEVQHQTHNFCRLNGTLTEVLWKAHMKCYRRNLQCNPGPDRYMHHEAIRGLVRPSQAFVNCAICAGPMTFALPAVAGLKSRLVGEEEQGRMQAAISTVPWRSDVHLTLC